MSEFTCILYTGVDQPMVSVLFKRTLAIIRSKSSVYCNKNGVMYIPWYLDGYNTPGKKELKTKDITDDSSSSINQT